MEDVKKDLIAWLHEQSQWVQVTVEKILNQGGVSDQIIKEAYDLLKTEDGRKSTKLDSLSLMGSTSTGHGDVRLISIGDIKGIDDLAPRTPLEFGKKISVIYGLNGAGKSGYTRILKKACGMAGASDLVSNVYKPDPGEKSCAFTIELDGVLTNINWPSNSAPIPSLIGVDIFDSNIGEIYLENERDVSYLPFELALMENLVKVFNKIKENLDKDRALLRTKLPIRPSINSKYVTAMYERLKHDSEVEKIKDFFHFTVQDEDQLKLIEEKLKTAPNELATQKRKKKNLIENLLKSLKDAKDKLDSSSCEKIHIAYCSYLERKKIAIEGATIIREKSFLSGIGEDTWKALWGAAKNYSKNVAYPNIDFPNIKDEARCVLCQQALDEDSKVRLKSLEEFVSGQLEIELKKSNDAYKGMIDLLPEVPTIDDLKTKLLAAQLNEEKWLPLFQNAWEKISLIIKSLKEAPQIKNDGVDDFFDSFKELLDITNQLEKESIDHDKDALNFKKDELLKELNDLNGKKWCSGFVEIILEEIERLKSEFAIDSLLKLVDTRRISNKAGELSEKLVTDAFVDRFNRELNLLGAKNIKVELVKSRVLQGKVKHRIQLHGLSIDYKKTKTPEVLSEGERKIVSLASFLADVTAKPVKSPFVFDDPITSLDQFYEESTVRRLIKLSEERQVIVFTHRLSLLGLFNDFSEPQCKYIKRESWGCGEHSDLPLNARSPINAIKDLKNCKVAQAKKALTNEGEATYTIFAKAICSEFRILLERIVEFDFLADVIRRHRRDVQTKNKLTKLAKINEDDCKLIDELMTKYSSFEHSQSLEAPSAVISPDELTADLDRLINWHATFITR